MDNLFIRGEMKASDGLNSTTHTNIVRKAENKEGKYEDKVS